MTLANAVPIKEQLLASIRRAADSRGRVSVTATELSKRHGLNGHDLVKNLEQLRKEGFIGLAMKDERITRIRLNRGAANEAVLSTRKPARWSATDAVLAYIDDQGPMGAWVALPGGWKSLSMGMKVPDDHAKSVEVTASKLVVDGVLEARRDGRKIVAVRRPLLRGQGAVTPIVTPTVAPTVTPAQGFASPIPETPHLDAYVAARRIARLAPEGNPYLTVEFTEDPIAEEGLALRAFAAALMEKAR